MRFLIPLLVYFMLSFAKCICKTNQQINNCSVKKVTISDVLDSTDTEDNADGDTPDTAKIVSLSINGTGNIYTVMYLRYYAPKRNSIVIREGNKELATMLLPRADEEIKNFKVVDIKKTQTVFFIQCDWGDWNNYYICKLYFAYVHNFLSLAKVGCTIIHSNKETETKEKLVTLVPAIKVQFLDLHNFLQNYPY